MRKLNDLLYPFGCQCRYRIPVSVLEWVFDGERHYLQWICPHCGWYDTAE